MPIAKGNKRRQFSPDAFKLEPVAAVRAAGRFRRWQLSLGCRLHDPSPRRSHHRRFQPGDRQRVALPHGPAPGDRVGRRCQCSEPYAGFGTPDLRPHRLNPDGAGLMRRSADPCNTASLSATALGGPHGWAAGKRIGTCSGFMVHSWIGKASLSSNLTVRRNYTSVASFAPCCGTHLHPRKPQQYGGACAGQPSDHRPRLAAGTLASNSAPRC